jgi:hypothetical protein
LQFCKGRCPGFFLLDLFEDLFGALGVVPKVGIVGFFLFFFYFF